MSQDLHTIAFLDGGANTMRTDRVLMAYLPGVAYPAGAGAGAAVVIPVTTIKGLPAKYSVQVTPDQDCTWFVTKGIGSFTVTLNPRLAANALAGGAIDIKVVA